MAGRDTELAAVAAVIARAARGRSGVLVVAGEPGMGKSTLLQCAADDAEGFRTVWTRGVDQDASLGYAGLLALLAPLRRHLPDVPAPQAAALAQALGWTAQEQTPAPLLVAGATLALLSAAAGEGPLLVVVDDAHWLDHESASALSFAMRRLRDDPIAFVVASRTGSAAGPAPTDLPTVTLEGLSAATVRQHWPDLTLAAATDLVAQTGGNPLVIEEVVPMLTPAQCVGAAPLPVPLPVGSGPRGYLAHRLAGLSADAAHLVLLHACAGPGEEQVVTAGAVQHLTRYDVALDEATGARALQHERGVVGLAHPLLRAVVLEQASAAERRAAHASLAEAAARLGRKPATVWHRAEAATGPDEALAAELAGLADERRAAGRAVASLALERAASLTESAELANGWLAQAAAESFLAGDLPRTRSLADRVLTGAPTDAHRSEVLFVLGTMEEYAGSVSSAAALLAEAAMLVEGLPAVRVLAELGNVRFRLGDVEGYGECAQRMALVADPTDSYQQMLLLFSQGWAAALGGDGDRAATALPEALSLAVERRLTDAQTLMVYQAGVFAPDLARFVETASAKADELRRDGLAGLLVTGLAMMAGLRALVGDHAGAFADAGEAVELAGHLGQVADAATAHERLAWELAARGLDSAADDAMRESAALLERAGLSSAAAHHALTAAFCALCRGDLDGVVATLLPRLDIDGGMGALGEPLGVVPMLVEALVGLGRRDEATELSRQLDAVTPAGVPPLLQAPRYRCRALVARDPEAARVAFAAAIETYTAAQDRFETARTRLLLGSWMRRNGERAGARTELDAAEASFARMDLTAWVAKARAERAATGERARRRGEHPVTEPLTSQETRVALLVARGMSNKEVAAHLFLSPRTVETHLTAVFRKRGYRNRAALAAAFRETRQVSERMPSEQ